MSQSFVFYLFMILWYKVLHLNRQSPSFIFLLLLSTIPHRYSWPKSSACKAEKTGRNLNRIPGFEPLSLSRECRDLILELCSQRTVNTLTKITLYAALLKQIACNLRIFVPIIAQVRVWVLVFQSLTKKKGLHSELMTYVISLNQWL